MLTEPFLIVCSQGGAFDQDLGRRGKEPPGSSSDWNVHGNDQSSSRKPRFMYTIAVRLSLSLSPSITQLPSEVGKIQFFLLLKAANSAQNRRQEIDLVARLF